MASIGFATFLPAGMAARIMSRASSTTKMLTSTSFVGDVGVHKSFIFCWIIGERARWSISTLPYATSVMVLVFLKRMTSCEEKQVERRNDEFFSLYLRYRDEERMSRNKAIETAAEHCGYGRSRGYDIADLREGEVG
jgi:hypothetical protein